MKRIFITVKEKWPEYLLEILVLIIGIYGAFAVDNWNENQKTQADEQELISNLKTDFELRLNELIELNEGRKAAIKAIDKIILNINAQQLIQPAAQFDSLMSFLYIAYSFNDEFSSLDMLFTSGKIDDLSNTELKKLLILWPWMVEEMLEEQRAILDIVESQTGLISKYSVINNHFKYFKFRDYKLQNSLNGDIFSSDYQGILSDREFANILTRKRAYLSVNLMDGEKIITLAKEIIQTLNEETLE